LKAKYRSKAMRKIFIKTLTLLAITFAIFNRSDCLGEDLKNIEEAIKSQYQEFTESIQDMHMTQDILAYTPQGEMKTESDIFIKGKKMRMDSEMSMPDNAKLPPGMENITTTIIFNDNKMWMIMPFAGKIEVPLKDQLKQQMHMNWWESISTNMEITGTESVDGIDCYLLESKAKDQVTGFDKIWLERKGFVIVKSEAKGPNGQEYIMKATDIRLIDNKWKFPYRMSMYMDGKLISDVRTKSIQINQNISDTLFDPNSIEAPDMNDMMQNIMKQKK